MPDWYENDEFWEQIIPLFFDESRAGSATEQVDDVVRLLQLDEGAQVLDVCCGIGRHAIELARRGFRVVGVDRTTQYLEIARTKAGQAAVQIEFVEEDMRAFCRPDSFDAAVNMFTSFGYFQDPGDDRRVIDNLYTSLKPGGHLLMEMLGKEILARVYQEKDWHEIKDGTLLLEERKVLGGWEWIEGRWIFIEGTERKEFTTRVRSYSGTESAALLRQAGFTSVALYGGLDGSPYDQAAKRLVVTAQKPVRLVL